MIIELDSTATAVAQEPRYYGYVSYRGIEIFVQGCRTRGDCFMALLDSIQEAYNITLEGELQ